MNLEPGEYKCDKCNGDGVWYCIHCRGTGKLDWIENIVGKQEPIMHIYCPYIPPLIHSQALPENPIVGMRHYDGNHMYIYSEDNEWIKI